MIDPSDTGSGSGSDQSTRPFEVTCDVALDERHSEAVVRAVATVLNVSPLDLDPLYDVIDPDHLDATFERPAGRTGATLSFAFNGCDVTVAHGEVHVRSREGDES